MKSVFIILILLIGLFVASSFINNTVPNIYSSAMLGKKLFSEKILSLDSTVSCASCHIPKYAFADTVAFSMGIKGQVSRRNTPSVLNMKNRPYFFYDGRAATLESQALIPMTDPHEMGLSIGEATKRLNDNKIYLKLFYQVFAQKPNKLNLAKAFAAYEKTLETTNSKYDDWANDKATFTKAEESGRKLFIGNKAKCFDCHFTEDFTGDDFKNIGLFNGNLFTDSGRYLFTKNKSDIGKFKVPGLRNIAVTAPYMHNGIFNTLEEVLRYYNNPKGFFPHQINLDSSFNKPLGLTDNEQADIISFLKTLTDKAYLKNGITKH